MLHSDVESSCSLYLIILPRDMPQTPTVIQKKNEIAFKRFVLVILMSSNFFLPLKEQRVVKLQKRNFYSVPMHWSLYSCRLNWSTQVRN